MPGLSALKKRFGKKDQNLPPQPQWQQSPSSDSFQPSSSTFNSSHRTNGSSWNSQISLDSPTNNAHTGLQYVPENPNATRTPAEPNGYRNYNWWSQVAPNLASPPPTEYQHVRNASQNESQPRMNTVVQPAARQNSVRTKDVAGAGRHDLERELNASAENVRRLRDLIRQKYDLDLHIWQKRKVIRADRELILPKCGQADRILQEIYFIVNAWDEDLFNQEEWQMVKMIKAGLFSRQLENGDSNEPAYWDNLKPWERRDDTPRV